MLNKLIVIMYSNCHADTNRQPTALDRLPGLAPDAALARRAGPGARPAGPDLRPVLGAGLPLRTLLGRSTAQPARTGRLRRVGAHARVQAHPRVGTRRAGGTRRQPG